MVPIPVANADDAPITGDAIEYLDTSFGNNGSFDLREIFGETPTTVTETPLEVGSVKADRIAIDSNNRIVVLASFYGGGVDNHILFRLNPNGSYDYTFGSPSPALRKNDSDTPKQFVLVTTTSFAYESTERVELEIDSDDGILVMLSGYTTYTADDSSDNYHHNFLARFTSSGTLDTAFGDGADGAIGSLTPLPDNPESVFVDFTLDSEENVLLVSLSNPYFASEVDPYDVKVQRFSPDGDLGSNFVTPGNTLVETKTVSIYTGLESSETGTVVVTTEPNSIYISYFQELDTSRYRNVQIIADDANGYIVAFSGAIYLQPNSENLYEGFYTVLLRLSDSGVLDSEFVGPQIFESVNDLFLIPFFLFTDLMPDGPSGFMMSGTSFDLSRQDSLIGILIRLTIEGEFDTEFTDIGDGDLLDPRLSQFCINSALHDGDASRGIDVGVVVGNHCFDPYGSISTGKIKIFSSSGVYRSELTFEGSELFGDASSKFITQLLSTTDGKIIALQGSKPLSGLLDWIVQYDLYASDVPNESFVWDWTQATISRYIMPFASTPTSTPSTPIYTPTPVPYLKTLSLPTLNLKEGKLVCTAGTYNAGYTLDGVIQGSGTSLFTPTTYTYNLNINGVVQSSLTNTSSSTTTSWDMPSATSGSLITCSVTVSANGVTNTDRSSDNSAGVSSAKAAQSASIAKAESDYSALLTANEKAYQKALIDNRSKWRNDAETLRKNYQAEIAAIRALPSTKETRGSSLAALKNYTAAVKKNSADYKASKPAALVERDAANKNALAAKNAAVESANAAYGIFIESIGYGVLVP